MGTHLTPDCRFSARLKLFLRELNRERFPI